MLGLERQLHAGSQLLGDRSNEADISERLQQLTKASKETECVPSDLRRRMRSHGSLAGAVACVGTALQY